ncbi:MAG: hypothetical protein ACJAQ1_001514, partial [Flavobacterium sp.]
PGTDVPNVHSDGVVGKGKSGPPVLSNPSNGNPWEKLQIEKKREKIRNVVFFINVKI